eukprot:3435127-Amphidinium_carterae.2
MMSALDSQASSPPPINFVGCHTERRHVNYSNHVSRELSKGDYATGATSENTLSPKARLRALRTVQGCTPLTAPTGHLDTVPAYPLFSSKRSTKAARQNEKLNVLVSCDSRNEHDTSIKPYLARRSSFRSCRTRRL